ncbi:hypothetical protein HN51_043785 [Arachis hypogaea]|uniref:Terpene synthase 2 n=1 Tax=Arachis hypogaea TaxID=3818 RepID=A0A444Y5A5_ARAHY|nr:probable terpene synthase 2 [Arachis hypogaea]QHN95853.1 (-)-germacrene D synthase [Arachis hypogaea]RYQ97098.1 hypothetical protein Ahy_B08g093092 [Arachis hypogaea]
MMTSSQHAPSNSKRSYANFAPSIWHDTFLKYADSESLEVDETMKQEVQKYRETVKIYLSSSDNNISQKLTLIDSIQRLSISYYFECEINEALEQIHNNFTYNGLAIEENDIYSIALLFRLFRQKGYHISSDIFNKFKNTKGEFDETIIVQDVKGMWSLYETAQLRIHGEEILEEAHEFTYNKLKSIVNQLSPSLAEQINQSLEQPLHKSIPKMRTKSYMSFYKKNSSHDKGDLLNFAKLDFNMVQKLYQKEVGSNTKWWIESDFARKVPYARDRLVEVFIWPFAVNSEPKYSTARRMSAKAISIISLIDDTYDVYGTIEELELFTEAMQRWDISCIASLPECFKVIFNALLEFWVEMESLTAESGKSSFVLQHVKQTFSRLAHAYLVEAKWCHEGDIPTYDEYKVKGVVSSGYSAILTVFIALVKELATKETLDWLSNCPAILKAVCTIARIKNDLASHKFEQQRKHVASAVECCMKQYDFSQEEAYDFIIRDINNCWKKVNEEYLKLIKDIPKFLIDCIVNLARITEFYYLNFEDKYTNCELLKDHIVTLFLDPIVV